LGPIERQAVLDQPLSEIDTSDRADRNGALVLVAIDLNAIDGSPTNEGIEIVRGLGSAPIRQAVLAPAKLAAAAGRRRAALEDSV
jgi:hypothetical protein